ncbi:MAG: DUF4127 family protein [Cyanophyceae cyanobacterium]
MKLVYIPLDERPCNVNYPQAIASLQSEIQLKVPPKECLSGKKIAAPIDKLWQWLEDEIQYCDGAILSIEMLIYGGLLPSRIHQNSVESLLSRVNKIHKLREQNPNIFILASNLIMRSPSYDSSEEEPDYYADWGASIFRWGWLTDKQSRQELSLSEQLELEALDRSIPSKNLQDYRQRRLNNRKINQAVIQLVKDGIIDFLSIPQDDSAEYGFTAMDQREIYGVIARERLQHKIHVYPGADEVGCTLLSRAYVNYCQLNKSPIKIYPLFSSTHSETIIPLYEDRPLGESLKAHILAAGGCLVADPEKADFILAINTAGQVMQEAWDQNKKDITYSTCRNLRYFSAAIAQCIQQGKSVAIADVAFANGGEIELIEMLDDNGTLDKVVAYAGWNTNCNTLGTAIATGIFSLNSDNQRAIKINIIQHLLEDAFYQGVVRSEVIDTYLPTVGASYYNFGDREGDIQTAVEERLIQQWRDTILTTFKDVDPYIYQLEFPWHRMFEIDLGVRDQRERPTEIFKE